MMKRPLFFFAFMLATIATHATGQEGDIICIDGMRWELLGKPIYADSSLAKNLEAALPKGRGTVTSNWAGYTAYWSIEQGRLCLDSIKYVLYNKVTKKDRVECLSPDTLLRVFQKYADGKRIIALWLNDDIRVARGKVIYYQHMGFERNYEEERFINIAGGKVCAMKDYHNYVVEGFSFSTFNPKKNAELREKFPLHIEQYPELAGAKRILFSIKRARVDAQGRLTECEVKVLNPDRNPRLEAEMAEVLKAYHPWRVSYINGEFRGCGIEGYTFPYQLEE